ncbi:MAG: lysylphosphatidylglycerol synthase domain-containing protein [Gemmatimonadaceae bacterium]
MPNIRRSGFLAAQWLFAAVIVWSAVRALNGQWRLAADRLAALDIGWAWIGAATLTVLLTYALLIETWRRVILAAGETLSFKTAARIWFISNLGKYVPGKVWSIAAMTVMARNESVSPMTAAGSSVLLQLVTIAAGIGVVLVAGSQAVDNRILAIAVLVVLIGFVAAAPRLLPAVARLATSLTGKDIKLPRIASKTVWAATLRAVISWVAYGVAFQFFVHGVVGSASGAVSSYIAVYAASYIIGFLALFAPGGAVVRESALVSGMVRLGLCGRADALAIAIASRLWLTVVELLPGLVFLAVRKPVPRSIQ